MKTRLRGLSVAVQRIDPFAKMTLAIPDEVKQQVAKDADPWMKVAAVSSELKKAQEKQVEDGTLLPQDKIEVGCWVLPAFSSAPNGTFEETGNIYTVIDASYGIVGIRRPGDHKPKDAKAILNKAQKSTIIQ